MIVLLLRAAEEMGGNMEGRGRGIYNRLGRCGTPTKLAYDYYQGIDNTDRGKQAWLDETRLLLAAPQLRFSSHVGAG